MNKRTAKTRTGKNPGPRARLAYEKLETRQLLAADLVPTATTFSIAAAHIPSLLCQYGSHQNDSNDSVIDTNDIPISSEQTTRDCDNDSISLDNDHLYNETRFFRNDTQAASPGYVGNAGGRVIGSSGGSAEVSEDNVGPQPETNGDPGLIQNNSRAKQSSLASALEPVSILASSNMASAQPDKILKLNISQNGYYSQSSPTLKSNFASVRTGLIDRYQMFSLVDSSIGETVGLQVSDQSSSNSLDPQNSSAGFPSRQQTTNPRLSLSHKSSTNLPANLASVRIEQSPTTESTHTLPDAYLLESALESEFDSALKNKDEPSGRLTPAVLTRQKSEFELTPISNEEAKDSGKSEDSKAKSLVEPSLLLAILMGVQFHSMRNERSVKTTG